MSIYFNPKHPASFAGPDKLYDVVKSEDKFKIGRYRIRKWLQDQDAYSLTRGARRHFKRSRVIVNGVDSMWDIDLMDMMSLAKDNDGFKYILVVIDVFSRYTWCQPLKSKTGVEVVNALSSILGQRTPKTIRSDKGREFKNKDVSKFLKGHGIHHRLAQNETKANYAERVIKTIKHKIFRRMLKTRTKKYIDKLQDMVNSYNHTVHRSLGDTPISVNKSNESESRLQQYLLRQKGQKKPTIKRESKNELKKKKRYKFKIGQTVRISHIRSVFDREYSQKWTGELFKVKSRYRREDVNVYTLEGWDGETIEGTFYEPELQAVNVDETTEYHIEKVLRKRTRQRQKEVLVRWLHWPKKYDTWIPEKDVSRYSL